MVEMIRIITNCDDVGITAGHLDVFWREHRQAPEYKSIQVRREKDDRALIEYSLMGFYWSSDGTDQRSKWSAPPYARIRFQALPDSKQKVRLKVSPLESSDRLMYPREPMLSEQGVVEFFQLFIAHLRNEGFKVQELQGPVQSEDSDRVDEQLTPAEDEGGKIEIFFAYAREDEDLRDQLEKHLSMLKRDGVITNWHDRKIGAGKEWEGEIDTHLNTARVILLLISSDFMDSDYCWDVEVKRAMERHEAEEARVIPIILRKVDWESAPFGRLQALPTNVKPVTSWLNRDEAFFDVAQGIRAAIMELRAEDNDSNPNH
jgi:hypothetical protein